MIGDGQQVDVCLAGLRYDVFSRIAFAVSVQVYLVPTVAVGFAGRDPLQKINAWSFEWSSPLLWFIRERPHYSGSLLHVDKRYPRRTLVNLAMRS